MHTATPTPPDRPLSEANYPTSHVATYAAEARQPADVCHVGDVAQALTAERLRELLSYDPETGEFRHRTQRNNRIKAGTVAGHVHPRGYVHIRVDRVLYLAHRLVWLHVYGAWPVGDIDHINGDRADARLANLRDVPRQMNCQNRTVTLAATGFMGTQRTPGGKFRALIYTEGKAKHVGTFDTAEAAHTAYVDAKRRLHEGNLL